MVSYPILNPVTCTFSALVNLGAMEHSFAPALEAFHSSPAGLSVPEIEPRWQAVRSVPLNSTTPSAFVSSARRMVEEANVMAEFFRAYRDKASPDSTVRFSVGHSPEESDTERKRQKARLDELTGALLPPGRITLSPRKTSWLLGLLPGVPRNASEALLVNQDGRAIHLIQPFADSILFGYGLFSGAMHYMTVDPEFPTGRSRAAFYKEQIFRYDTNAAWVSQLTLSLQKFYAPQTAHFCGKIRLTVTEQKSRKVLYQSPPLNAGSEAEFRDAARHFNPGNEIVAESEELVAGRRGGTLSTISAVVPLSSVRCVFESGAAHLTRSFYFPEQAKLANESPLPEDFKRKIRFAKPA